ncbi:serine hydrolase domain-containing protein [Rivibacter subsaxonicus]|nr:serine hydrolase [Rivibacter subsaxonicus]
MTDDQDLPPFGGMAIPELPDPASVEPLALGLMQGLPPPPDKRITLANYRDYPNARWAYRHMRELAPTLRVWRGRGTPSALEPAPRDLLAHRYEAPGGARQSIGDWFTQTYGDGLLVLHRGRVVLEHYAGGMQPQDLHLAWSVSKSFVGLLAQLAIEAGQLDPEAPIGALIPELNATSSAGAWTAATVRQVLDMTAGIRYREIYTDPSSEVFGYAFAGGLFAPPAGYAGPRSLDAFLPMLAPEGEHGAGFHYKTAHTEVLAWLVARATGTPLAELLSRQLWQPLGMEEDGAFGVDPAGTAVGGGGLNLALRDLGRTGAMLAAGGRWNGRQIVPTALIEDIRRGGDREKFKASGYIERFGYSYRNQWWVPHDADGSFEAKGIHGQHLHVNPAAELVVAKFSSHPVSTTLFTQHADRAAFAAIAAALRT